MNESVLIGRRERMLEVSAEMWREHLAGAGHPMVTRLSFMTGDHHRVRNFVVRELPRNQGKPLNAGDISGRLDLSLNRVVTILEELQRNLFFVVLNNDGEVSWAFPVTSDWTTHRLSFSNGERVFAA